MKLFHTRSMAFWPCVATALLLAFSQAHKPKSDLSKKGIPMPSQSESLPFGLNKSGLAEVEILYGFYSSKTGAGKQEITISGNGRVKLFLTRSFSAAPETIEVSVPTDLVVRLLDLMAGEGFLNLNDHYPAQHDPHARRVIRLSLPDADKTVIVDEPNCPEFERVAGAISLLAGIASPEALGHRLFPNL